VPRKKQQPVDVDVARRIGGLLRGLRRSAGYRAVKDAARQPECPAAQQTIYAYERGGLVPSLKQLMELVEFYALQTEGAPVEVRYQGVAAMVAALSSPAYHLQEAWDLVKKLQPPPTVGRRRRRQDPDES
jgi:hypothetical protein